MLQLNDGTNGRIEMIQGLMSYPSTFQVLGDSQINIFTYLVWFHIADIGFLSMLLKVSFRNLPDYISG